MAGKVKSVGATTAAGFDALALHWDVLAAPLVDVQFLELDKVAVWTMTPFLTR